MEKDNMNEFVIETHAEPPRIYIDDIEKTGLLNSFRLVQRLCIKENKHDTD